MILIFEQRYFVKMGPSFVNFFLHNFKTFFILVIPILYIHIHNYTTEVEKLMYRMLTLPV